MVQYKVNINFIILIIQIDKSLFFNIILIKLVINYQDKIQNKNSKMQLDKNALVYLNLIIKQANYELYIII